MAGVHGLFYDAGHMLGSASVALDIDSQGGATRFEQLKGDVDIANKRLSYRNVDLGAGILSAQGNFDIEFNQAISGNTRVALQSSARQLVVDMRIDGTLKGITLKP